MLCLRIATNITKIEVSQHSEDLCEFEASVGY